MNKLKLLLISSVIILFALASYSCSDYESMYNDLLHSNAELQKQYDDLLAENEDLEQSIKDDYIKRTTYDNLLDRYSNLSDEYSNLESDYKSLEADYNSAKAKPKTVSAPKQQAKQTVSYTSQQPQSGSVYATTYGEKYHRSTCRYVKNKTNVTAYTVEGALARGLTACSVCY